MNKGRRWFRTLSVAVVALIPVSSGADSSDGGLAVVPKLGISYKNVALEASGGRKTFSPNFVTLDVGLTMAYKAVYLSLGYDTSIKDDIEHNTTPSGSGTPDDSIFYASRDDAAATLGYNVWRGLSIFGGYKYGKFDATLFADVVSSKPTNATVAFVTRGPFLGVGYSFRFAGKGSLDLSVAYASMDGELKQSTASGAISVKGDATGFSYGVAWSGALSDSAGYAVGLKATRYSFDGDPPPGTNEDPDTDEIHKIFYFAIQKYF